jgi:ATP-dependent Lon protease
VLAAHRGGIKTVLIPGENERDISDIPQQVLKNVSLIKVDHMDQVLQHALVPSDPDSFFKPKDASAIDDARS